MKTVVFVGFVPCLLLDVGLCVGNFDNESFLAYIFLLIQYLTMLICMNKKPQANIRKFHHCTYSLLCSCVKYIDENADTYLLHLCLNQISFCTDSFSSLVPILQARKKISSLSFPWPSHKHAESFLLLQNECSEGDNIV